MHTALCVSLNGVFTSELLFYDGSIIHSIDINTRPLLFGLKN